MTAIYKKELKSYLTSMIGYLFMAFTLALFGLYFTAIDVYKRQIPIRAYGHLYEACAVRANGEDGLSLIHISVEIQMEYNAENGSLEVDFAGEDMGILIGKRGQTLDSLQYLTSLVVNKEQKDYVRVKLDTENYRKRRKETLENLARNIAYKVKKTRRPVSLEPMNPYERRIIDVYKRQVYEMLITSGPKFVHNSSTGFPHRFVYK